MRESILNDLYFGRINPWERERIHTREYRELADKIIAIEDYFKNLLSPEAYKKFEEIQDLRAEANVIESVDLFEYAFRTGALMMIDLFDYEGND